MLVSMLLKVLPLLGPPSIFAHASSMIEYEGVSIWSADWWSSPMVCVPGLSTYSSNVIESYWQVLHLLHGKGGSDEAISIRIDQLQATS